MTENLTQSNQHIEALVETFNKAMNTYNTQLLAECFTPDADFTNVKGRLFKGRRAIEQAHAPLFAAKQLPGVPSFYGSRFEIQNLTIRFIKSDVASIDIYWQQNGTTAPDGNPWPVRKGLINTVAIENNGVWLFVVSHNMLIA